MTPGPGRARPGGCRPRIIVSIYDDEDNRYYAGGGPAVVQRIVRNLAPTYDVVVLTGGAPGARRERRHGATYVPLPLSWAGPRVGQALYTLLLLGIAAFARYDLWVESFTPPFSSSFLPYVTRRPVLGVAQALSGREMARRYHSRLFLLAERRALRSYDDVVVLNEFDAAQVSRSSPGSRVHHIPNTTEPGPPVLSDAGDGTSVLYLGRIDFDQKGLGRLFDAYGQLGGQAGGQALPLVLAGSGRPAELRQLEEALQVAGPDVCWVGYADAEHKQALLDDCAFVVVPSVEESFCLVALEALTAGRPVVHFDLPQLSWIPAECGIKVPRFDTGLLAEAVRLLSTDVALRSRIGSAARAFAEEFRDRQDPDVYARLVGQLLPGPAWR